MIIILIGPMGCGKTTIGRTLSEQVNWPFEDADDFHPESNIQKMKSGIPLTDADRIPWLNALYERANCAITKGQNLILACSALKKTYRELLHIDQKMITSVFLKGSYDILKERIENRNHQYMAKELLDSQLDTLEEPKGGVIVDIIDPPEVIANTIIQKLKLN